jgi:hypothetical protein
LIAAGVPEPQAKVHADTLRGIIEDELTTKKDLLLTATELKLAIHESKHDLLKWIISLAFAQAALIITLFAVK